MDAIFLARGPLFRNGYVGQNPIQNMDLFPLLCHLSGIPEPPNNGSLANVIDLLEESENEVGRSNMKYFNCGVLLLFILVLTVASSRT